MEIILYLFIGILVTIILPIMVGLSFRGFEETFRAGLISISDYLGTYLVYVFFIIGALFLTIYPIASLLILKRGEHPATKDKPKWYRIFSVSYLFNPEDGALWKISEALGNKKNIMRWSTNIFRVIILSIIIFGAYGILIVSSPQFQVVGVPQAQLEQQITPTADVIFGAGIPSFSENGILLFVLFFLLGIDAFVCARFIKDKKTALLIFFIIAFFIICPLMGTFWMSLHRIVYGNSEASLLATWIFGFLGSAMTILTGIFIWWFMFHFMNNFFIKLSEIVTIKEDVVFISIIILAGILIFWILTELIMWRFRKKRINDF